MTPLPKNSLKQSLKNMLTLYRFAFLFSLLKQLLIGVLASVCYVVAAFLGVAAVVVFSKMLH